MTQSFQFKSPMKLILFISLILFVFSQTDESWRNTINPYKSSCATKNNFATQWILATDIKRTQTNDSIISTFSLALNGYVILILTRDQDILTNSLIVASFYNTTTGTRDVIEMDFKGPIADLFLNYTVVPTSKSRIWGITTGHPAFTPPLNRDGEIWVNFRVNTSVLNEIDPQFIIWLANTNTKPLSWDNFNQDPNQGEKFALLPQGMNETITPVHASPYFCLIMYGNNLETVHWSLIIVVAPIWIILFILVAVLQILKKQPITSKGIFPLLTIFLQFISLTVAIYDAAASFEQRSNYECFFSFVFYYMFFDTLYLVVPLQFLRFILILNINKLKGLYYIDIQTDRKTGQKKQKETVRWQFKCMNLLSKWWVYASIMSVFLIIYTIIILGVSGGSRWLCTLQGIQGMGDYETVNIVFIILFAVLFFAYDLILNLFKACKCPKPIKEMTRKEIIGRLTLYDYFIKEDPFHFRLEFWIWIPLTFIFFICNTVATDLFIVTANRVPPVAFYTLTQICIMMYMFGSSLIVTLFWVIRDLCFGKQEKEEINLILEDDYGREIFSNFAKQEWSIENISIYDDIQDFFKEKNPVQRQLKATNIYYNYLNGQESKLEVNINKNLCVIFKNRIDSDPDIPDDVFGPILQAVKINLADTYSRLRLRADFKNWKKTRDIRDAQLKGEKVQKNDE